MGGNPMELAKPKVIKIAETRLDRAGVHEMLESLGVSEKGEERFERMPDNGEALCELSGRMCYESFEIGLNPNVTKIREDSKEYFKNLLQKGDGSVAEHGSVSFVFLGVSRIFTHELARHRVGIATHPVRRHCNECGLDRQLPDPPLGDRNANRSVGRGGDPTGLRPSGRDLQARLSAPLSRLRAEGAPGRNGILAADPAKQGVVKTERSQSQRKRTFQNSDFSGFLTPARTV